MISCHNQIRKYASFHGGGQFVVVKCARTRAQARAPATPILFKLTGIRGSHHTHGHAILILKCGKWKTHEFTIDDYAFLNYFHNTASLVLFLLLSIACANERDVFLPYFHIIMYYMLNNKKWRNLWVFVQQL